MEHAKQKITTFLMFDGKAEEATNYYLSVFDQAEILSIYRYGANEAGAEGTVAHATFSLYGQVLPGKHLTLHLQAVGSTCHILSEPQPAIGRDIDTNAHLVQSCAEQVDAVPATERLVRHAFLHGVDASPRCWIRTRQPDILAAIAIAGKPFIGDALALRHTIRTCMAEPAVKHVPTMQQCARGQRSIPGERRQTTGRPIMIDQLKKLRGKLLSLR